MGQATGSSGKGSRHKEQVGDGQLEGGNIKFSIGTTWGGSSGEGSGAGAGGGNRELSHGEAGSWEWRRASDGKNSRQGAGDRPFDFPSACLLITGCPSAVVVGWKFKTTFL